MQYLQRVVGADRAGRDTEWAQVSSRTRLRHAYLFVGPPQVGKSTVVRAFAKALLCTGEGPQPCGKCRSCRLMEKGAHSDFRLFSPTDSDGLVDRANGELRVEASAEVIHDAALRPVEGRYKIFHIQDAHMARREFSNKILKTLEEPPGHVVICVTATDRSLLLPTIVSRCEVIDLRPIPVAVAKEALAEGWNVEGDRAELLARLCGGRLGWAVRQLEETGGADKRLERLAELRTLVDANRVERLRFSEQTAADRNNRNLFDMLELWVTWWRDVLLTQHGCADAIRNLDQQTYVEDYAGVLSQSDVQRHLETLQRVERYLHHTVNTRLAMDALLLDMPRRAA